MKPNRSDKYQVLFHETPCSNDMMENFSNLDSIYAHLSNGFIYNEDYLNLQDRLKDEFWRLAEQVCTDRQLEIMGLLCQGMTQWEIAKTLGVNQSSVTKSVRGNTDYSTIPGAKRVYGGLVKKMTKAVERDPIIQQLLLQLQTCQDNIY